MINSIIYVAGGTDNNLMFDTLESYNPANNTWTTLGPMPRAMALGSYATANGKLYLIGGVESASPNIVLSDAMLEYDPANDSWTSRASPTGEPLYSTAVAINGRIQLVGGVNLSASTATRNNEAYTPPTTVFVLQKN